MFTSVKVAQATPKALELLEEAKKEKGEDLTKFEVIKVAGPTYIPALLTGAATITCIVGINVLNKRQQASMASAYALLEGTFKEYKKQVNKLYGEEVDGKVREEIAKEQYEEHDISVEEGKHLFFDNFSMRYFESTIEDVQRAEYRLNREFRMKDCASVNEFYDLLGIPRVENGDKYGWSSEGCYEFYGHSWIDFDHEKVTLDDGLECYILSMPLEPIYNYYNY